MSITGFSTCLFFVGYFCCCKAMPAKLSQEAQNDRPVIGILTQIVSDEVMMPFGNSYIPASYVKYIESGGSRVMPIRLTHTTAEYIAIFRQINGLVLIGGAVDLEKSDFARVAKIFFTLSRMANDAGDFFPIWGTCMGMQLLTVLVAGENLLTKTPAENIAMPLNLTAVPVNSLDIPSHPLEWETVSKFLTEAPSSRMFAGFRNELMNALTQEPLTGNFHHYGLTVTNFQDNEKLQSFFTILSTNIAENGAHFVSTIEGKKYPFYGTQWHPEVNRFQWDRKLNFPHSCNAVQVSSLLAEFFSNEGRRSFHQFHSPKEEASSLIYNYKPVYAANFTAYEQVYFF